MSLLRSSFLAWVMVCAVAWLVMVVPARADCLGLASDGRLGPSSDYTRGPLQSIPFRYSFNTDTGIIRQQWTTPGARVEVVDSSEKRVITQADGSEVMLFEFTTFDLPSNIDSLAVEGSRACAILATGDITIGTTINVKAAMRPGAAGGTLSHVDGYIAPAPGGGIGGFGTDHGHHLDEHGNVWTACSGGGGGGGNAASGRPGRTGTGGARYAWDGERYALLGYVSHAGGAGGGPFAFDGILRGGGGGGGGGFFRTQEYGYPTEGGDGGSGGGAVLFDTPGNLTIEATGLIAADGKAGKYGDMSAGDGGGGAGGCIVFEVDGVWTNWGTLRALGGPGGTDGVEHVGDGGVGAGGRIVIDPSEIYNHGMIDVSSGDGSAGCGGLVVWDAPVIVDDGQIIGQLPEPATLMLLSLGGLAVALRRRP